MARNGGEIFTVANCWATPKAFGQFYGFVTGHARKGINRTALGAMFVGEHVRRFADDSKYFLYVARTLRYVFTVENGYGPESGRFVLVTVAENFDSCSA